MGMPSAATKKKIIQLLNPTFPAKESAISKETAQLLLYLDADGIVKKIVEQLEYHTEQNTVTEGVEMLSPLPSPQPSSVPDPVETTTTDVLMR